jgi:hypothetical protein
MTYSVSCTPGYLGNAYNENFRIWIDYSLDGDFDDENELVFDPQPTTTEVNGSFSVPSNIGVGTTRMRVSMAYTPINTNNEPPSCGNLIYGEIEDYCVTLSTSTSINNTPRTNYALSPNPASTWIQFNGNVLAPNSLVVVGMDGKFLSELDLRQWPRIDLPQLAAGYYVLKIQYGGTHQSLPLIITE